MPVPPDVRKALAALEAQQARAREEAERAQERQRRTLEEKLHTHRALVAGLDALIQWAQGPEAREAYTRARAAGLPWVVLQWPVALGPESLGRLVVGGGHVGFARTSVEDLVARVPAATLEQLVQDLRSGAIWQEIAGELRAHLALREGGG